MKIFRFKHHGQLPIPSKNYPRSKALEAVCLSRFHLPPIAAQSPQGEGQDGGDVNLLNASILITSGLIVPVLEYRVLFCIR
jgi:hypothetical protein